MAKKIDKEIKKIYKPLSEAAEQQNRDYIRLISIVKKSRSKDKSDRAFDEIMLMIKPKIKNVVVRFRIVGYDQNDIYQEALRALRFKAIEDYDQTRGFGEGPALFDRFALLCIRRHLSTEFKSSRQSKKKVLNTSVSIDKDNNSSHSNPEELSLSNILSANNKDVITDLGDKEYFRNLMVLLSENLSNFEKQVLVLYKQRYSYEEIADKINKNRIKVKVNIKAIDNALMRVKAKARSIFLTYQIYHSNDQ